MDINHNNYLTQLNKKVNGSFKKITYIEHLPYLIPRRLKVKYIAKMVVNIDNMLDDLYTTTGRSDMIYDLHTHHLNQIKRKYGIPVLPYQHICNPYRI
jgi:hypothetical protein